MFGKQTKRGTRLTPSADSDLDWSPVTHVEAHDFSPEAPPLFSSWLGDFIREVGCPAANRLDGILAPDLCSQLEGDVL